MIFLFADFEIDTELYEIRKNGRTLSVEPKVFDLIMHFAQNPDQIFNHDDLIESVWSGRIVSDATVAGCIKNARKILGDSGNTQTYIKTVRGRGFRFTADVTRIEATQESKQQTVPPQSQNRAAMTPTLMILPFRALSASAVAIDFAESLGASLGAILTRIPLLRLCAQSFFNQGPLLPNAQVLHEDLGVDYVFSGRVHLLTNQIRINVQLSDAHSGFSLWAENFVVPDTDEAFENSITAIVAKLEPQLHRAIYDRVRSSDGSANANELFLQASGLLALKGWHHDSFSVASDLLRRSWRQAPEFAQAASYLSLVLGLGHRLGLMDDQEHAFDEALHAAEQALQLDNMDSTVLGLAGCALADLGFPNRALPILRNAIDLNPDNAQAWTALGTVSLTEGKLDEAITHLRHGIKISPLDSRLSVWGGVLATALRLSGDIDEALEQAQLACQRDHRCYMPRVILASILYTRKEHSCAQNALDEALRIKPDLSPAQIYYLVGQRLGCQLLDLF